jgi:phytoene dehydrogenase-like protein
MKPTITIIGAGISGLSAGLHLHRKGFTVKIIEASDRVGGRIKTDS